jgi:DNA-binding transcriptional regulator YdaS (Cro superfamily)
MSIPASERSAIAERVGINAQYLYQCLTGRRDMDPAQAVEVERQSKKAIRRWDLRRNDWWRVWPELVGAKGAPEPTAPAESAA